MPVKGFTGNFANLISLYLFVFPNEFKSITKNLFNYQIETERELIACLHE